MAFLVALFTILALPAAWFLWTVQCLLRNRAIARATGLPYLIRWVSPLNPFWLLYGSSFVRLCRKLGIASENLRRIYPYGWEASERADIHIEYGDVIQVVHPGGIQLTIANAETIYEVLRRRTDFRRNMEGFAVVNVYGKNLSTTDDEEWQRHRKMTVVTFTEKNNELVWEQSLLQAKGMLEYWTERAEQPIRSTHKDTKILTLNILAAVLFNKVYPFEGHDEQRSEHHENEESYQYRNSLSLILGSIIQIFIFGENGLKAWWTPSSWKSAATAMSTFRSYILGLMDEEKARLSNGEISNHHLVARLVRACEDEQSEEDIPQDSVDEDLPRKMTLTKQEILSNLFVYAFAGNDTTAIVLHSILIHLAAKPETQYWISDEINYYLPTGTPETWSPKTFFKLKRCGAVIMESLRMFHPLSQLVKTTNSTPQPLQINGKTYMIPAQTAVYCSLPALHTHPRYWGSTRLSWNPSRFISNSGPNVRQPSFESEVLAADTSDHFLPWAWGQRVCPGKRFSQFELVAVLAVLFRDWRVVPEQKKGESLEEARTRAWKASLTVEHEGHILHEMFEPESVGLRWIKRVKE